MLVGQPLSIAVLCVPQWLVVRPQVEHAVLWPIGPQIRDLFEVPKDAVVVTPGPSTPPPVPASPAPSASF